MRIFIKKHVKTLKLSKPKNDLLFVRLIIYPCVSRHSRTWRPHYYLTSMAFQQLFTTVPMNASGMICLFFIEIVSHPHLASSILRRILMHWYQEGIFFFLYNLLSNDLLIVASTLTENYQSFLGNQIFTPFMGVYVAQVSGGSARGNWLWGAAVCETLRCHTTATANGMPNW